MRVCSDVRVHNYVYDQARGWLTLDSIGMAMVLLYTYTPQTLTTHAHEAEGSGGKVANGAHTLQETRVWYQRQSRLALAKVRIRRGVAGGGVSRCPEIPPAVELFFLYVDYDGRKSPNWLGPLAYYRTCSIIRPPRINAPPLFGG